MLSEEREIQTPPRSKVPWMAIGVVLVAAGVLTVAVRSRKHEPAEFVPDPQMGPNHPAVGKRLEGLELQPLTGDPPPLATADLQGRVTLINFWGTWCPPCRVEFPHLAELERHLRSQADFRFVSVSCSNGIGSDEHIAGLTSQFLKQQRADFPTYRDAGGASRLAIAQTAGNFVYPTTLLVGRDGKIRALWLGYAPGVEQQMRKVALEVLAEPPQVGPANTPE
jgi:thiol-disulfide isomerase/thioredoxin